MNNDDHSHSAGKFSDFKHDLYAHLVERKEARMAEIRGPHQGDPNDIFLPNDYGTPLYAPISELFDAHQQCFPFKTHRFFQHMASSQAACANLFLPLLAHPEDAAPILRTVKPDLCRIAVEHLDRGFRLEFWDTDTHLLNDHNKVSGTDADIAIAYYDHAGTLKLWLIEHKLSEQEFTTCGGARSKGRSTPDHSCASVSAILDNPNLCYYHSRRGYNYWRVTRAHPELYPLETLRACGECPFKGGLNQLWRNQLLAAAIEQSPDSPFKSVFFSVVCHPKNHALQPTIERHEQLIQNSDRFFAFRSDQLVEAASGSNCQPFLEWAAWYRDLYYF